MRVETNSIKKTTGTKRNIPVKLSKNIICCISQKNIFTFYNNILANGALNMVVALLSMQGQKAFEFHQTYLNLCSEDEQRSCGFGTT